MFKYFQNYNNVIEETKKIGSKYSDANSEKRKTIKWLIVIGVALTCFIALFQFIASKKVEQKLPIVPVEYEVPITKEVEIIDDIKIPQEEFGRGQEIPNPIDALNPFSSFQESIVDAISQIALQGIELFDDYVSFTPNVAKSDGQIVDARGEVITLNLNKYYNITNSIAWLLLPLIIVIVGSNIVLSGQFRGVQLLIETGKKVGIFVIALISTRYIFLLAINLINSLNVLILQSLVPFGNSTLSETLVTAFGMTISDGTLEFNLEETLNIFGEIILWIGLAILLTTILFQFIIRFFHLILHYIMFPIMLMIGLLPSGERILNSYIEEVVRTLIVQPIFLIGLALSLEIITGINEPIPKIVLGLGSLAFLNLIPSIVARFSGLLWGIGGSFVGGALTLGTISQIQKVKEGFVSGASDGKGSSLRTIGGKIMGGKFRSAFVEDSKNKYEKGSNNYKGNYSKSNENSFIGGNHPQNERRQYKAKEQEKRSDKLEPIRRSDTKDMNKFDTGNKTQWNDLSNFYAQKQSEVDGKPVSQHIKYANNPLNKMSVVNESADRGYFNDKNFDVVEVNKNKGSKKSKPKYFKILKDERDSTTKIK